MTPLSSSSISLKQAARGGIKVWHNS
jgi:hypothetical protein